MIKKLREPVNGLTHAIAAAAAFVGLLALLFVSYRNLPVFIANLIYGVSLILMFSSSAVYHSVNSRPAVMRVLRKLDHSAIYALIAGTYTPICMHYFDGFWRWGILAIVWGMAAIGIGIKIFVIRAPRWVTAGVYLVMGWISLLAIGEMLAAMPTGALIWLLAGGLLFTLGAVIYITKKPDFFPGVFGFHEIWHIFVILGALAHFIVVFAYVGLAAG